MRCSVRRNLLVVLVTVTVTGAGQSEEVEGERGKVSLLTCCGLRAALDERPMQTAMSHQNRREDIALDQLSGG